MGGTCSTYGKMIGAYRILVRKAEETKTIWKT